MDARKLADLLRTGMLRPVYHGENGLRTLRELARSYQTISKDLNRVMNRLKALYRGWGIACSGTQVYAARYREEWLHKIPHAGVHRRRGGCKHRDSAARVLAHRRFADHPSRSGVPMPVVVAEPQSGLAAGRRSSRSKGRFRLTLLSIVL